MGNLMEPWKLEPARDTGLTPSERFRSVRRESGLLESLAHHVCFSMLRSYFAIAHRLTIIGRDKLPAHGPFVLAANHCSHLDALILGAALTPRHRERSFPIAAGDVFFQSNVTSTFSAIMLNALPMWRKNCGPHALADLRRKLQEEKAIFIIFPEGGRSRTDSRCSSRKRMCPLFLAVSLEPLKLFRHIEGYRNQWRSSWFSEMRSSLHQQPMIGPAGRRSQPRSNPLSEI